MFEIFGVDKSIEERAEKVEAALAGRFARIDRRADRKCLSVLKAMQDAHVSGECMNDTTGYGYGDIGRDTLERVYAALFEAEDALVRPLIACGTHALTIALSALLRPGDELLYISGKPYDTLESVIGIRPAAGSLAEYGISYGQVELTGSGHFDIPAILRAISPETNLIGIQRSRGYAARRSLPVAEIADVIRAVKAHAPQVRVMVDNCYGEFVEDHEPTAFGADLCVGSLIKNPGGGIAPTGGYLAGTRECVELCAVRMTSPGLGREVGASIGVNRSMYQGLFFAPQVAAAAEKAALFAAALYASYGFEVSPSPEDERTDIIQSVTLGSAEAVVAFCRGIQNGAPVDSFVSPEPWDIPGYDDPVVMASGGFIAGSSIELSADAPIRAPYAVYFQGGLNYPSAKAGIMLSAQRLFEAGLLNGGKR